jgi:hypothetical protein
MTDREQLPWEQNRRRDLEAAMADEVPGLGWHVRQTLGKASGNAFLVSTDVGVYRYVRGLTKETARTLAHELALAARLRDG